MKYKTTTDSIAPNCITIEKTAEDLLGYSDDKINIFGIAYKNEIIERDLQKGLL